MMHRSPRRPRHSPSASISWSIAAGANANSRIFLPPTLDGAREEMEVNVFGLLNMVRAFAPAMQRRRQGTIVNMLSMVSLVNVPRMATYCASKAAAYSLTQAIRAELDALWHPCLCDAAECDRHADVGASQRSQAQASRRSRTR